MAKLDDFDKCSHEEREEIIQKAKDNYMRMIAFSIIAPFIFLAIMLIFVMLTPAPVVGAVFGMIFMAGVFVPIVITKTNAITKLNKIMTIEEKVKFFGSQAKHHLYFKQLITFDYIPTALSTENSAKYTKNRKRICIYCGGTVGQNDEVCPGCGSRQFIEK